MKYNHALAERQFRAEWRIKLRFYRKHGMTLAQILPLYKMDKAQLRSDRRYYEHTEPLDDFQNDLRLAVMPVLATYDESNWVDALPDELSRQLSVFPEERLLAFYMFRVLKYTQSEIAVIISKPQQSVSRWIIQIAEIISEFQKNG